MDLSAPVAMVTTEASVRALVTQYNNKEAAAETYFHPSACPDGHRTDPDVSRCSDGGFTAEREGW